MTNRDSAPDPSAVGAAGNVHDLGVESGLERVRRLQHEMHALAEEQVEVLARDLVAMAARMAKIAEGGEAYPVGVRELCSRTSDELGSAAQSMQAIMERSPKI